MALPFLADHRPRSGLIWYPAFSDRWILNPFVFNHLVLYIVDNYGFVKIGALRLGDDGEATMSVRCAAILAVTALAIAGGRGSAAPLDHPTATPTSVGFDASRLARLDQVFNAYVQRGQLAGVSVLVARHGKVVYLKSFGERDLESHAPMQPNTIVRLYSMSKPITAAAVMAAYEEGHFLLTDPISEYIPELAKMNVYAAGTDNNIKTTPAVRPILVENLLTHTSGFSFDFQPTPIASLYDKMGLKAGAWFQTPEINGLGGFAKRLAEIPLVHQPGTQWHYGMSLDIAALVIERTTGEHFDAYLKSRLLKPLHMDDTGFYVPPSKAGRLATLYAKGHDGKLVSVDDAKTSGFLKRPYVATGSGGLTSTIGDYFRFAQMLCNDGELEGTRILSPASVDLMLSNHLRPDQLGQLASTATFGFGGGGAGMGFGYGGAVIENVAQTGGLGSDGLYTWGGAGSTTFFVDRKNDVVAVLVTQLRPSGTYPLFDALKQMVYQALIHPER
jgi:CubicO group peptidase (beta-lactamase class C family)